MTVDTKSSSGWAKLLGDELERILDLTADELTKFLREARKNPGQFSVSKLYVMSAMFELIKEKNPKLLELMIKRPKDAESNMDLVQELKKFEQIKKNKVKNERPSESSEA